MKTALMIAATAILAAGCSEMTDYYPNAEQVEIDGRWFFVSPHPRAAGVYVAGPNKPAAAEVFLGDGLAMGAANVRAIEAVTGCGVQPATIKNTTAGTTWAAVSC